MSLPPLAWSECAVSVGVWSVIVGSACLGTYLLTRWSTGQPQLLRAILRVGVFFIALTLTGFVSRVSQQLGLADPSTALLVLTAGAALAAIGWRLYPTFRTRPRNVA